MRQTIQPRSGTAFTIKKGELLKVIDPEGEQVADLYAFNEHDKEEFISSGRSLDYNESIQFKKKFRLEIKKLLSKLNYKNVTFVHRDFHVSNLMYYNKKIAVIDSQDALIGNRAYDLASLIDDVRLKTSNELKEKVFKFYVKTNKKINLEKFKKDFEILSVLRNLKIIGIFMRLAARDNKKKYLKLIPYAWEMINHRIKEQSEFNNLMLLLKNNFPKFIR